MPPVPAAWSEETMKNRNDLFHAGPTGPLLDIYLSIYLYLYLYLYLYSYLYVHVLYVFEY